MTLASFKSKEKRASSQEFWALLKTESHWSALSHMSFPEPITVARKGQNGFLYQQPYPSTMELGGGGASPSSPQGLVGRRVEVKKEI